MKKELEIEKTRLEKVKVELKIKKLENKYEKWKILRQFINKSPWIVIPICTVIGIGLISGEITIFDFALKVAADILNISKYSIALNIILLIAIFVIIKMCRRKLKSIIENNKELQNIVDTKRTSSELNKYGDNEEFK